jgi:hypothetical protein
MSRGHSRRPSAGGFVSGQVVYSSLARERMKTAAAISRQALALAARARAVGLNELSRRLEAVAMEATSSSASGDE